MDYATHSTVVAGIALLSAVSPGLNFVMITGTPTASRAKDFWSASGVASASLTWVMLRATGLAVVIANVVWLYEALQIVGAVYLVFLGLKMLWSARSNMDVAVVAPTAARSAWSTFRRGYLVNMSNPKSAAFVASFFASILPFDAPT